MSNKTIIEAREVSRIYKSGEAEVTAIRNASLSINAGDQIAIIGSSGSGKTTLLHLLAGLDSPTSGDVLIDNQSILKLSETRRGDLRNAHLGFIFQFHHLLPELSALENVAMPLLIRGMKRAQAEESARNWLDVVGLDARRSHRPAQLSGGERQRTAIARAVVNEPACLLADEPTGNLDHANADNIFEILLKLNQEQSTAIVVVTHDQELAKTLNRQIEMRDGAFI